MSKVNIRTISEIVGVAPSTVSRVMSGNARKYRIAKATEAKILETADKLGFKPNYLAQSLNTNKTYTIGLVFANTIDEFLGSILEGVEARLRDTQYQLTIATCENSIELEKKEIQRMLYRQVDGIIIYPSCVELTENYTTDHLNQNAAKFTPYVVIGRRVGLATDHVLFSDYKAGEMAALQFLKQQCKQFVALTLPIKCSANEARIQGFIETLAINGVTEDCISVIVKRDSFSNADIEVVKNADCIFSVNTLSMLLTLMALRELINPEKYQLFSLGSTRYKDLLGYNLTTIPMPGREMGWQAAEQILARLEQKGEDNCKEIYLNWKSEM